MPIVDTSHRQFVGLKRGKRGPYVKNLQKRLANVLSGKERPSVDGAFGPGTERSLIAFQKLAHLPMTGVVDLDTDLWLLEMEMGSCEGPVKLPEPRSVNLANHVDRKISSYCKHKDRVGDEALHCAHWVSHLLEYPRASCGPRSVGHYGNRASNWIEYDPDQPSNFFGRPRLIYVAWRAQGTSSPFRQRGASMSIRQPRHIGILLGDSIFHYENNRRHECVRQSPSDRRWAASRFIDRYHYKGKGACEHWTSDLPPGLILNITNSGPKAAP